jgi:FlaA1/EpsC-like NDP-sugar epimerase
MDKIFAVSPFRRLLFFLALDLMLILLSFYLSLITHYELNAIDLHRAIIPQIVIFFAAFKILSLAVFRIYQSTWRYVGISDLISIFLAILLAELALTVLSLPNGFLPPLAITGLSKRIFFVDGLISFFLIAGLRISKRIYLEVLQKRRPAKEGIDTLIIGAGNTGEMLLRDLMRTGYKNFNPIGFLDDNPDKSGTHIHGVKVIGCLNDLDSVISQYHVKAIIIAIPQLNHKTLRKLYDAAKKADVKTVKIVPRIYDFSRPDINMKSLESIHIEDLVGRQTVTVDYQGIREFIRGKSVLITGAGGSIGSEIVVQICAFDPRQVILFDIDETELHNMGLKLQRMFPHLVEKLAYVAGDVRDVIRLQEVFDFWRPQIVFHAAAYKHVPMMEYSPKEAIKVNVFGTFRLASTARDYGVEKFIMISSDKAVRPTSVMGATKRMAEFICSALNEKSNSTLQSFPNKKLAIAPLPATSTQFISVRFGNVLGSRGSVLPLFLEQLKYGGPLTVTHRKMRRYFMTIPEAVSLVLQASILGKGGDVLVLDMGEPARIIDIAEELIRIHGMEPYKDIDIQITEQRPGEKLFEEILTAEEGTVASLHKKVFIAKNNVKYSIETLQDILNEFSAVINDITPGSNEQARVLLKKYVVHYKASEDVAGSSQQPEAGVKNYF